MNVQHKGSGVCSRLIGILHLEPAGYSAGIVKLLEDRVEEMVVLVKLSWVQ